MDTRNQKKSQSNPKFKKRDQAQPGAFHQRSSSSDSDRSWRPVPQDSAQGGDFVHSGPATNLIYLSCLSPSIGLDQLFKVFKKFGRILKIEAFTPFIKKSANRFAVITFESVKVSSWLVKLQHVKIQKKKLKLSSAESIDAIFREIEHLRLTRVYVNSLPPGMTSKDLGQIFSQFGEIEKAYVVKKNKKSKNSEDSKRNGTIIFKQEDTVTKLPEQGVEYRGKQLAWKSYYFNFAGQPGNRRHYISPQEQYGYQIYRPQQPGREDLYSTKRKIGRQTKLMGRSQRNPAASGQRFTNQDQTYSEQKNRTNQHKSFYSNLRQEERASYTYRPPTYLEKFQSESERSYGELVRFPHQKFRQIASQSSDQPEGLDEPPNRQLDPELVPFRPSEQSSNRRPYASALSGSLEEFEGEGIHQPLHPLFEDRRLEFDNSYASGRVSEPRDSYYQSDQRHRSDQYLAAYQEHISEENSIEYSSSYSSRGHGAEPKRGLDYIPSQKVRESKRGRRREARHLLRMIGHLRSSDEPWRRENLEISSLRADFSSRVRRGFLQGIVSKHLGSRPTEVRYHQHRCFYNHDPHRNIQFRIDKE